MSTHEAPSADPDSIAAIGRKIADDAGRLVHAEIELAKAEMARAVRSLAVSVGMAAAAVAFVLLTLFAALGALADGVGQLVFHQTWPAWGILAILFLVLALLMALFTYRGVRRVFGGGKETVNNIKEDVEWLKHLTKRNGSEI